MRGYEGPWIVPALEARRVPARERRRRGDEPPPFRPRRRAAARGRRAAFPHATIVAQKAEWEVALGDNPRLVASYVQPELTLVEDWGAQGWADGEREILPGVTVVPTGGHSAGHQAIVVRGGGRRCQDAGVLRRPAACGRGRPTRAG